MQRKINILLALGIMCTLLLASCAGSGGALHLTLQGEREMYIDPLSTYVEPGVSVTCGANETADIPVQITGTVDPNTPGTYLLKYMVQHEGTVCTAYRKVHVADREKPVITLVSDPQKYTLPGQTYEEEGFTAQDNYDGDLTAKVIRKADSEKVIYSVSDSSGNLTVVERPIVYHDPEPPKIKLNGPKNYTMLIGGAYAELGCTATDNCDGDLSAQVKIHGQINRYIPGEYVITYSVNDSYGNTAAVSRTVSVQGWEPGSGEQPVAAEPNGKIIYLTFDDGPGKNTPRLLKVLQKYNVKATFFVVDTAYIDTVKDIAQAGHALAIHTTTHVYKDIYASEEAYFQDVYNMQNIIKEKTGQEVFLLRFPGGSSNKVSLFNPGIMTRLTAAVQEKGFYYFDWNVDSRDAGGAKTPAQVFQNVTTAIEKNEDDFSVVLQHDIKSFSIDAVESIIVWGLEHGYTFLPLTQDSPGCHHALNN